MDKEIVDREIDRIAKRGTKAWERLQENMSWKDWLVVGEALVVLREVAKVAAGIEDSNEPPSGYHFNHAMGTLLERYKLDEIDKGARSRLVKVMDKRAEIETWYNALPISLRMRLNHPESVLRRWEALTRSGGEKTKVNKTEAALQVQIQVNDGLRKENEELKERIRKLEQELEWVNAVDKETQNG